MLFDDISLVELSVVSVISPDPHRTCCTQNSTTSLIWAQNLQQLPGIIYRMKRQTAFLPSIQQKDYVNAKETEHGWMATSIHVAGDDQHFEDRESADKRVFFYGCPEKFEIVVEVIAFTKIFSFVRREKWESEIKFAKLMGAVTAYVVAAMTINSH